MQVGVLKEWLYKCTIATRNYIYNEFNVRRIKSGFEIYAFKIAIDMALGTVCTFSS